MGVSLCWLQNYLVAELFGYRTIWLQNGKVVRRQATSNSAPSSLVRPHQRSVK